MFINLLIILKNAQDAVVNGKKLAELSFDFIVEQQKLIVE